MTVMIEAPTLTKQAFTEVLTRAKRLHKLYGYAQPTVHLKSDDERLTVTLVNGFDPETGETVRPSIMEAVIEESVGAGDAMVPLGLLTSAVSSFKGRGIPVEIKAEQVQVGRVTIEGAKGVLTREDTFDPECYSAAEVTISNIEDLPHVCRMASKKDNRPMLNHVAFSDDRRRGPVMVSTDSFRLAICPVDQMKGDGERWLIAARSLVEAAKATGPVNIRWKADRENGLIEWETKHARYRLHNRSALGDFPAWDLLIPRSKSFTSTYRFTPDAAEAVEQIAKIGRETPLQLEPAGDALDGKAVNSDDGTSAQVKGIADTLKAGESQEPVGLNADYLKATLKWLGACKLQVINPLRPVLVTGHGGREVLMMPIRLNA